MPCRGEFDHSCLSWPVQKPTIAVSKFSTENQDVVYQHPDGKTKRRKHLEDKKAKEQKSDALSNSSAKKRTKERPDEKSASHEHLKGPSAGFPHIETVSTEYTQKAT